MCFCLCAYRDSYHQIKGSKIVYMNVAHSVNDNSITFKDILRTVHHEKIRRVTCWMCVTTQCLTLCVTRLWPVIHLCSVGASHTSEII